MLDWLDLLEGSAVPSPRGERENASARSPLLERAGRRGTAGRRARTGRRETVPELVEADMPLEARLLQEQGDISFELEVSKEVNGVRGESWVYREWFVTQTNVEIRNCNVMRVAVGQTHEDTVILLKRERTSPASRTKEKVSSPSFTLVQVPFVPQTTSQPESCSVHLFSPGECRSLRDARR
jgi:hypothetical protein